MKRTRASRFESGLSRRIGHIGVLLAVVAMLFGMAATAAAQEEQQRIVSTLVGEVPTTGALRPGPIGIAPAQPARIRGPRPVSISIEKIGVNAEIETIEIVDGVMQDPTGPWVVSWYKETARLGEIGNIVMAGHLDYWDVGPAVFYNIAQLAEGDQVKIVGEDGKTYVYEVDWVRNYDNANAPIQEIVGPTDEENLTLITCGGPFDYTNGVYLQRTVVRAHRVQQ